MGYRLYFFLVLLISLLVFIWWYPVEISQALPEDSETRNEVELKQSLIPEAAYQVLNFVLLNGSAPEGYSGGKNFYNREKRLPQRDSNGKKIVYREWDIYPKIPGKSRGPERLITGADGSAWYTADHYLSFIQLNKK